MSNTISRRRFLAMGGLSALAATLPRTANAAEPTSGAAAAATPTTGSQRMKVYFSDPQFDYQLLRLLGEATDGGADIGECLTTAQRITEGDFESWYAEWLATARRLHTQADAALKAGHNVSARETYLRAANYYRSAEFYLHGNPADPRIMSTYDASIACFRQHNALSTPRATAVV